MSDETAHEWIEVKHRRWCLGCSAFQTAPWPKKASECPRDTPWAAIEKRRREQQKAPS